MKKLFLTTFILGVSSFAFAQEIKNHEIKNFEGLIRIQGPSNGLIIEGYNGKDVIVSAESVNYTIPEEAKGLKLVTAGGMDNTGLAVSANESTIKIIKGFDANGKEKIEDQRVLDLSIPSDYKMFKNYKILVPRKSDVSFKENNYYQQIKGEFVIDKLAGELDVNCFGCNLNVKNFEGNIIASSSLESKMKIEFSDLDQSKISSISSSGNIDITLPKTTTANLFINSRKGNIFTDFDLKKVEGSISNSVVNKDLLSEDRFTFEADTIEYSGSVNSTTLKGKKIIINDEKSNMVVTSSVSKNKGTLNNEVIVIGKPMSSNNKEVVLTGKPLNSVVVKGNGSSTLNNGLVYSASTKGLKNLNKANYQINGGGVYISITSFDGNIYLRKK